MDSVSKLILLKKYDKEIKFLNLQHCCGDELNIIKEEIQLNTKEIKINSKYLIDKSLIEYIEFIIESIPINIKREIKLNQII